MAERLHDPQLSWTERKDPARGYRAYSQPSVTGTRCQHAPSVRQPACLPIVARLSREHSACTGEEALAYAALPGTHAWAAAHPHGAGEQQLEGHSSAVSLLARTARQQPMAEPSSADGQPAQVAAGWRSAHTTCSSAGPSACIRRAATGAYSQPSVFRVALPARASGSLESADCGTSVREHACLQQLDTAQLSGTRLQERTASQVSPERAASTRHW